MPTKQIIKFRQAKQHMLVFLLSDEACSKVKASNETTTFDPQ